jgi:hypothetical protein
LASDEFGAFASGASCRDESGAFASDESRSDEFGAFSTNICGTTIELSFKPINILVNYYREGCNQ